MNALIAQMAPTAGFDASQTLALWIVGMSVLAGTLIAVSGIVFGTHHATVKVRATADSTREMLARGMSAHEIALVLTAGSGDDHGRGAEHLPCASEVVVLDSDGDWVPGLVLQSGGGRYYVHYVGTGMDDNEWVGADRLRFPAGSRLPELLAHLGAAGNGYGKGPVEAEL